MDGHESYKVLRALAKCTLAIARVIGIYAHDAALLHRLLSAVHVGVARSRCGCGRRGLHCVSTRDVAKVHFVDTIEPCTPQQKSHFLDPWPA